MGGLRRHSPVAPVNSPFGSGILFVPKANGKLRMVVDYPPIYWLTVVDKFISREFMRCLIGL